MKDAIQKQMIKLFNSLSKPQKNIVNTWVIAEMQTPNCAHFITSEDTTDTDGKKLCVMLAKALEADDFSAFTGEAVPPKAPASAPKPAPKEKVTVLMDEPKIAVVHIGSEPKPSTTPEIDKLDVKLPEEIKEPEMEHEPEPTEEETKEAMAEVEKLMKGTPRAASPSLDPAINLYEAVRGMIAGVVAEQGVPATPATPTQPVAPSISEDRIREIIAEELGKAIKPALDAYFKRLTQ